MWINFILKEMDSFANDGIFLITTEMFDIKIKRSERKNIMQ